MHKYRDKKTQHFIYILKRLVALYKEIRKDGDEFKTSSFLIILSEYLATLEKNFPIKDVK